MYTQRSDLVTPEIIPIYRAAGGRDTRDNIYHAYELADLGIPEIIPIYRAAGCRHTRDNIYIAYELADLGIPEIILDIHIQSVMNNIHRTGSTTSLVIVCKAKQNRTLF